MADHFVCVECLADIDELVWCDGVAIVMCGRVYREDCGCPKRMSQRYDWFGCGTSV